jgi:predicted lipoprotein with Yx(FWY)xxD motif
MQRSIRDGKKAWDMGPEVNARRGSFRAGGRRRYAVGVAAFALGAIALAGCSSSGGSTASPGTASTPTSAASGGGASAGPQTLTVKQAPGGKSYLADSTGQTLYLFVPDPPGKSICTGQCAAFWPPLTGTVTAGSGVPGTLTTFQRDDGGSQAVINGHPLYRFTLDKAPGQTAGEGLNENGGLWYMVDPAGNQITSLSG